MQFIGHGKQVPVQWEEVSVSPVLKGGKTVIPDSAIQSVKKNTVALKGSLRNWRFGIIRLILRCRTTCNTQSVSMVTIWFDL